MVQQELSGAPSRRDLITSYVPAPVIRRFSRDPAPLSAPELDRTSGAVLFVDVSGFAALTKRLAEKGPAGVEAVAAAINRHYENAVALIESRGGEVLKFAGDGVMAVWPVVSDADLSEATWRAADCSLALLSTVAAASRDDSTRLDLRAGIGVGDIALLHVGGRFERWEMLVTGAPLVDAGQALQRARSGDVILAPGARDALSDHGKAEPAGDGFARLLQMPPPPTQVAGPSLPLDDAAERAVRRYVPRAVLGRVDAGQGHWLAELRWVSVLFANIAGLDPTVPDSELPKYQLVIETLQDAIYRFEGSVNQIRFDEKGLALVAVWGLPPLPHQDDPARATQAAMVLQEKAVHLGVQVAIGVTTGTALCGAVGSERRHAYSVTGDRVNLAARLMQANDGVLCDVVTRDAAARRIAYEARPALTVRGWNEPVPVFRPRGPADPLPTSQLVGRTTEQEFLAARLAVLAEGTGGVVIVEGEPGIGKTALVDDLAGRAREAGVTTLLGSADPHETSTSYSAWRPIFQRLLDGGQPAKGEEARRAQVLEHLPAEALAALPAGGSLADLGPLLAPVLQLDWPETDVTRGLTGEARAEVTREVLVQVLAAGSRRARTLVILEDAHWFDSASWALAGLVNRRLPALLLVITTRPLGDPPPVIFRYLRQEPSTFYLRVGPLSPHAVEQVVCQRLGVTALPEPLVRLLQERAEGNPFYCEELVHALRENGLIEVVEGICRLAPGASDLPMTSVPPTLQGIITGRIDRLHPSQQTLLKVASVIGQEFSRRSLEDIFPEEATHEQIDADLVELERQEIIRQTTDQREPAYAFRHAISRDVAYGLLPYARRRQLHGAIAAWYERTYSDSLPAHFPLLAYHWSHAIGSPELEPDQTRKAITYLEAAGEQAARNYANAEAIRLLSEALRLDRPGAPNDDAARRRAHWEMLLGDAYYNVGSTMAAREHLRSCLALLSQPVPGTTLGMSLGLAREAARLGLNLVLPSGSHAIEPTPPQEATLTVAGGHYQLGIISFTANDLLTCTYAHLRAFNLARKAGPSAQLANSCATVSVMAGVFGLTGLADRLFARSLAVSEQLNDPGCLANTWFNRGLDIAGRAACADAIAAFEQAARIYEQIGNHRWLEIVLLIVPIVEWWRGKFDRALAALEAADRSAWNRGDRQSQAWALQGRMDILVSADQLDEALAGFEKVGRFLGGESDAIDNPTQILAYHAGRGLAYARRGDWTRAMEAGHAGAQVIRQSRGFSFYAAPACAFLVDVGLRYAELLGANGTVSDRQALAEAVEIARAPLALLRTLARPYAICRPGAWILQGRLDWLEGNAGRAQKNWRRGLQLAERLGLPIESGIARYEIGRHLPPGEAARTELLSAAAQTFAEVGMAYERRLAEAALGQAAPERSLSA